MEQLKPRKDVMINMVGETRGGMSFSAIRVRDIPKRESVPCDLCGYPDFYITFKGRNLCSQCYQAEKDNPEHQLEGKE